MHNQDITMQIKPLPTAIAALSLASICTFAPLAQAVHFNPAGTGQVLIYPYYTARDNYATALSVTNTTDRPKALKVRFIESRAGAQVMDLNVFIKPYDVWTVGVVATDVGAKLITTDNTCVLPLDLFTTPGKSNFQNTRYVADSPIHGSSLDRTREGYAEIIEMGVDATTSAVDCTEPFVPVPPFQPPAPPGPLPIIARLTAPTGGLIGRSSIINSAEGTNFIIMPTVLEAWSDKLQYADVGSDAPRLSAASPPVSTVMLANGDVIRSTWDNGRDAVSAALMRATLSNEFILDAGTQSQSDWIVTFPTKRDHVTLTQASAPFTEHIATGFGGCEATLQSGAISIANRDGSGLLPPPVTTSGNPSQFVPKLLCWTATVLPTSFAGLLRSRAQSVATAAMYSFMQGATTTASVLTSANGTSQGPNGWLSFNFSRTIYRLTPRSATRNGVPANVTHYGLPVISHNVHTYRNAGVASTYGGVIPSTYTVVVE